ncbi:hypothetical protein FIBSPDRAFT_887802 [Athelia psychrophila]|uniref:Uncharacterized protein n=1 Tax=Athelia psychrophila TaxID=1759441 RepID=A0A166P8Q7_9AGAM|nr:hypothetical protein FIBSPDRAFT_887802 [Fibularhizoctonia sp. CBS 109695]
MAVMPAVDCPFALDCLAGLHAISPRCYRVKGGAFHRVLDKRAKYFHLPSSPTQSLQAMDIINEVISLTPVAPLATACRVFKLIWDLVERVQESKRHFRSLAWTIAEFLKVLNSSIAGRRRVEDISSTSSTIIGLQRLLDEIRDFIKAEGHGSFLTLMFTKEARIAQIDGYQKKIATLVNTFQLKPSAVFNAGCGERSVIVIDQFMNGDLLSTPEALSHKRCFEHMARRVDSCGRGGGWGRPGKGRGRGAVRAGGGAGGACSSGGGRVRGGNRAIRLAVRPELSRRSRDGEAEGRTHANINFNMSGSGGVVAGVVGVVVARALVGGARVAAGRAAHAQGVTPGVPRLLRGPLPRVHGVAPQHLAPPPQAHLRLAPLVLQPPVLPPERATLPRLAPPQFPPHPLPLPIHTTATATATTTTTTTAPTSAPSPVSALRPASRLLQLPGAKPARGAADVARDCVVALVRADDRAIGTESPAVLVAPQLPVVAARPLQLLERVEEVALAAELAGRGALLPLHEVTARAVVALALQGQRLLALHAVGQVAADPPRPPHDAHGHVFRSRPYVTPRPPSRPPSHPSHVGQRISSTHINLSSLTYPSTSNTPYPLHLQHGYNCKGFFAFAPSRRRSSLNTCIKTQSEQSQTKENVAASRGTGSPPAPAAA